MFLRILIPSLLGASSAFACVSSTRCLAEVQDRPFTLVQSEADAVLVKEYALANGCIEVTIDSIERHVNSIPRSITVYPGPADEPLSKLVPVNPDSIHLCLNGDCGRIVPQTVRNAPVAQNTAPPSQRVAPGTNLS